MDFRPDHRGVPLGPSTVPSHPGPRRRLWRANCATAPGDGHSRSPNGVEVALAECVCIEADRLGSKGISGPCDRRRRGPPAPYSQSLCGLLQQVPYASVLGQGRARRAFDPAGRPDHGTPGTWRTPPPVLPNLVCDRDKDTLFSPSSPTGTATPHSASVLKLSESTNSISRRSSFTARSIR